MPVLRKTINYFANINKYSKSKLTEIGGYSISDSSALTDKKCQHFSPLTFFGKTSGYFCIKKKLMHMSPISITQNANVGKTAPSEAYLAGEWGYTGSRFVFMANEGPTPDNRTMEFRTSVGIITIKGFLVQENGKLILAYKRSDLFMIMQYLCSPQGRKNISPLGKLLAEKNRSSV